MLKKLIPTLQVDIRNDDSDLTPQERMVLELQYQNLAWLDRANEKLDDKALGLLQASSLIIILVGALQFPGFIRGEVPLLAKLGIGFGFVVFLLMVYFISKTWSPTDSPMAGPREWNELYNEYIFKDRETAYNRILAGYDKSQTMMLELNARKARSLQGAIFLFILQIGGLLAVAMLS